MMHLSRIVTHDCPARIYGSKPNQLTFLYPLRILDEYSPTIYPEETPDLISKIDVGQFAKYKSAFYIGGVLDFLIVRAELRDDS